MANRSNVDAHLLEALTNAYTARAKLFHTGVVASEIDLLIAEIDGIRSERIDWESADLGITPSAFKRVQDAGGKPHQVFAHPSILAERPHLVSYYRNVAAISRKGIGQLLFPTERYESSRSGNIPAARAQELCRVLNTIVSGVIDSIEGYKVSLSRKAVLAEIGTQLQGTWANIIGRGAAKHVEEMIDDYVHARELGTRSGPGRLILKNGWSVVFAPEPDVAFFDDTGKKAIAIEIKGSLDKAGAQTRYGEAKKSFAKQIQENPRCHTIYLASCFTDAVIRQIKADGQVRAWYNLTSILYDDDERSLFLKQLFHIVSTPTR